MACERKQKLIDLGADAIADALLQLAVYSEQADDLIDRLIATPTENVRRFEEKLSDLKRLRRFIHWRGASKFSRELEMLLQDLKSGVSDPLTGVRLVAAFYEADESIFEMCDDSSGMIGDVFRHDAKDLFLDYACRCADKGAIADVILKMNREDNYGIRDSLINCAGEYLPEEIIRTMIATLQAWADKEIKEHGKRRYLIRIESLARQIKDAKLFEKTRIASWGELSVGAYIDIARVYLESGDVETARSWLEKCEGETFRAYERDTLLREVYQKQGDSEKLKTLLYAQFNACHSIDTLESYLDVVGPDRREEVVADEVKLILKDDRLRVSDAGFLMAIGKMDEAEAYLLGRADQLNGDYCGNLLPLAETMESEGRCLVASLIFRSLLLSILERGYTKAYPHGVRYLKKLDKLAAAVSDWQHVMDHDAFKEQARKAHGRKRSFWSKYEVKT